METVEGILSNRYQKNKAIGFYGLLNIKKEKRTALQDVIHRQIIQLYQKGYRFFCGCI